MPRIIEPPKEERGRCIECGSCVGYTLREVEKKPYMDFDGRVKCPRVGCAGYVGIIDWRSRRPDLVDTRPDERWWPGRT